MMKAAVIFLRWDQHKAEAVHHFLEKGILAIRDIDWTVVHVDNRDEEKPWSEITGNSSTRSFATGGDNSLHEFSGWEKGLKDLDIHNPGHYDILVFCNDALMNSKPYRALNSLNATHFELLLQKRMVMGWHDSFHDILKRHRLPQGTMAFGSRILTSWMCTAFFALPGSERDLLVPLATERRAERIFSLKGPSAPFSDNSPVNSDYQRFLVEHQTRIWYRSAALDTLSFPRFRDKALMCINEQLLGHRLLKQLAPLDLYRLREHERALGVRARLNAIRRDLGRPLKLALYGAGKHSSWLQSEGCLGPEEVQALFDDTPKSDQKLWGRRIQALDSLRPDAFDAIVLSTDTFQDTMSQRIRKKFGDRLRIIDLYT